MIVPKKSKYRRWIDPLLIGLGLVTVTMPLLTTVSCSNVEKSGIYLVDTKLKSHFVDWYNSLSEHTWNKDEKGNFVNYYSESEQQSIALYANFRGWFWNEALHRNEEPINQMVDINLDKGRKHEIRGSDYQKVVEALDRAIFPYPMQVYHGVEYQEDEFYHQLKNYIKNQNGKWDFSETVGKTITSHGFISTSLNGEEAFEYCGGWKWDNSDPHLPLIEPAFFIINIPEGTKGAAYLANFKFSGTINNDNQVLINRNTSFTITKVEKKKRTNIFYMDMIPNK